MTEELKILEFKELIEYRNFRDETHNLNGPAQIYKNGTKKWYKNGLLHREDGPAIEWSDGDVYWYYENKLHRKLGPAMEYKDGSKRWYYHGVECTYEEFCKFIKQKKC